MEANLWCVEPPEDDDQPVDSDAPIPLDELDDVPVLDQNVKQRLMERC